MEYAVVILLAILSIIIASSVAYRMGVSESHIEKEETGKAAQRETLATDHKIQSLTAQIEHLNKINDRYLSFMVFISSVIQRLNTTLREQDIVSTIMHLVNDLIPTDNIELYIFDAEDNLLKKALSPSNPEEKEVSYALGDGLIGRADQDNMTKVKGQTDKGQDQHPESHLWMAVPINFKDRMLGVIAIGNLKEPVGNENTLMKMIADIAAVALINREVLGEARQEATTDPLTGLHNRRYFFNMTHKFVEKAIAESSPVSIFLFDIDNFKHFNDNNGHGEGDKLLKELSRLILESTRKSSVVARYGGEEFIVMLPGIFKEDAYVYADRLRKIIAEHPFPHREKQPLGCVSISGGVASFPNDADSIQKAITLADKALYQAKSEGRNRVLQHQTQYFS